MDVFFAPCSRDDFWGSTSTAVGAYRFFLLPTKTAPERVVKNGAKGLRGFSGEPSEVQKGRTTGRGTGRGGGGGRRRRTARCWGMREDRSSDPDADEGWGELALSLLLEEEKKGMQDDADNGMKRTRGRGDIVRVVSGGIEQQKYGRGTERGERPPRRIAPEKRGDDGRGRRWYRPKRRRRRGRQT